MGQGEPTQVSEHGMQRARSRWRTALISVMAVTVALAVSAPSRAAGMPVTACTAPQQKDVVVGYVDGDYLGLWTEQPQPGETEVCYQFENWPSGDLVKEYAVIDVITPTVSAKPPVVDGAGDACVGSGGQVLFSDTTALGTVTVSDYRSAGADWICLQAPAGISKRVVVAVPAVGAPPPSVGTVEPVPITSPWPPTPWPSTPSDSCIASGAPYYINLEIDGTHLWEANFVDGTNERDLCVREQRGAGGAGGVVTYKASGLPQVGTSSDLTPCTTVLNDLDSPVYLHIDASPPGSTSQSVCIKTASTAIRLSTAVPSSGPVSFTPDP